MNRTSPCSVVAVLVVSACSSPVEIASTPLAGTVAGEPWTLATGHTNAFLSEGEDDFFATLYPMSFTACGLSEPGGPRVLASIPKQPGDYELGLGLGLTMTFYDDADNTNLIATEGRIVVDAVTATSVTGGLHAIYDGDNEVDGQFDIAICAN